MKKKNFLLGTLACLIFSHSFAQDWNYTGKTGPNYWGKLYDKYKLCGKGLNQSPINIGITTKISKETLALNYHEMPLYLHLDSKNLFIKTQDLPPEYVVFRNQKYFLQQLHFHTPSEHTFFNNHYAMEAHLVHKNTKGEYLVIGVMVKKGQANKILHQILSLNFPHKEKDAKFPQVFINPINLIPKDSRYYIYSGSLTTPPCSENVTWIIMKKPIEASLQEIELFQTKVIPFNTRLIQPLNKREIYQSK